MAQVYFHCSNDIEVRVDQLGAVVRDLSEARDHAACVVRSLIMEQSAEDWRDWTVHVSGDFDDEIFAFPSRPFSASRIEVVMSAAPATFMPLLRRLDRIVTEWQRLIH